MSGISLPFGGPSVPATPFPWREHRSMAEVMREEEGIRARILKLFGDAASTPRMADGAGRAGCTLPARRSFGGSSVGWGRALRRVVAAAIAALALAGCAASDSQHPRSAGEQLAHGSGGHGGGPGGGTGGGPGPGIGSGAGSGTGSGGGASGGNGSAGQGGEGGEGRGSGPARDRCVEFATGCQAR